MKRFLGRWILATCAAFGGALLPATSQAAGAPATTPTAGAPARPKVCLVLSGGGARGAAHVGVIKVLEEYARAGRLHRRHQHGRAGRRRLRDRA